MVGYIMAFQKEIDSLLGPVVAGSVRFTIHSTPFSFQGDVVDLIQSGWNQEGVVGYLFNLVGNETTENTMVERHMIVIKNGGNAFADLGT